MLARLFFGSLCAGVVRRFSPLSVAMKFEVARARGAVQRAGTERPLTRSRDRKHRRQVLEPGLQGPVEKNKHRAARVFPAAGLPCGIFLSHSLNQRDWQRQSDNARREREGERGGSRGITGKAAIQSSALGPFGSNKLDVERSWDTLIILSFGMHAPRWRQTFVRALRVQIQSLVHYPCCRAI